MAPDTTPARNQQTSSAMQQNPVPWTDQSKSLTTPIQSNQPPTPNQPVTTPNQTASTSTTSQPNQDTPPNQPNQPTTLPQQPTTNQTVDNQLSQINSTQSSEAPQTGTNSTTNDNVASPQPPLDAATVKPAPGQPLSTTDAQAETEASQISFTTLDKKETQPQQVPGDTQTTTTTMNIPEYDINTDFTDEYETTTESFLFTTMTQNQETFGVTKEFTQTQTMSYDSTLTPPEAETEEVMTWGVPATMNGGDAGGQFGGKDGFCCVLLVLCHH
jgi:hypothetical protein